MLVQTSRRSGIQRTLLRAMSSLAVAALVGLVGCGRERSVQVATGKTSDAIQATLQLLSVSTYLYDKPLILSGIEGVGPNESDIRQLRKELADINVDVSDPKIGRVLKDIKAGLITFSDSPPNGSFKYGKALSECSLAPASGPVGLLQITPEVARQRGYEHVIPQLRDIYAFSRIAFHAKYLSASLDHERAAEAAGKAECFLNECVGVYVTCFEPPPYTVRALAANTLMGLDVDGIPDAVARNRLSDLRTSILAFLNPSEGDAQTKNGKVLVELMKTGRDVRLSQTDLKAMGIDGFMEKLGQLGNAAR
jgi:hypothetical protein